MISGAIFGILAVLLGGFVLWDRLWRRAGPENPGRNCATVVQSDADRPLSGGDVDRVALVGDSLMFEPSCTIAASLSKIGITTSRHAISGSGLLTNTPDWMDRIRVIMAAEHPDVVVAVFAGNYGLGPPARTPTGAAIGADTPEFFSAWQAQAEAFSAVVRSGGAEFYWVSPPPIAVPPFAGRADRLFEGYRTIDEDKVLTSGSVLGDNNRGFVAVKTTCGGEKEVRTVDGVHLTDDGARIYGQQIAHDLTGTLGLLTAPRPC